MDTMASQVTNNGKFSSMDVEQDAKQLVQNQFQTVYEIFGLKKGLEFLGSY
jgi:hypothetical protein